MAISTPCRMLDLDTARMKRTAVLALACLAILVVALRIKRPSLGERQPPPVRPVRQVDADKPMVGVELPIAPQASARRAPVPASLFSKLLADDTRLGLSPKEEKLITKLYAEAVHKREEIENRLAKADVVSTGETLITIPAYKAEGKQVLDEFVDAVSKKLGTEKTAGFMDLYSGTIRSENGGFGENEQSLLVDATPTGYHVVHKILSTVDLPSGPTTVTSTSTSELLYENTEGQYDHLSNLFPAPTRTNSPAS